MSAIRTAPVPLPADVVAYIWETFQAANLAATTRLDRMPTTHEENLDFAFIEAIDAAAGPHITPSGVTVDVEIHFIGGGRHFDRWEIADIGLLLNFRRSSELVSSKVVLLQSKRLYPLEADFVEFRGLSRVGGFGSLMERNWTLPAQAPRTFNFEDACRYKAMQVGDEQWARIEEYERLTTVPVHYLLYHPGAIPYARAIPTSTPFVPPAMPLSVGARVMPAAELRQVMLGSPRNYAPSYGDLSYNGASPGLSVEDFVRDEVLSCKQGYVSQSPATDLALQNVFYARTGPIAAAIRFDIDVPEGLEIEDE